MKVCPVQHLHSSSPDPEHQKPTGGLSTAHGGFDPVTAYQCLSSSRESNTWHPHAYGAASLRVSLAHTPTVRDLTWNKTEGN